MGIGTVSQAVHAEHPLCGDDVPIAMENHFRHLCLTCVCIPTGVFLW